jgi:aspartate aminotransferase
MTTTSEKKEFEGCPVISVKDYTSTGTFSQIAQYADAPYILLYTKTAPLELGYRALERMTDFMLPGTGMVYSEKELREIAEVIKKHDLYVISDEIYEKLVYDFETPISIAAIDEDMKNRTIIVNGVSKTFAMTGWRIGYTAANAEITKIMANVQSHYTSNPNSIAQAATVAALTGPMDSVETMKKAFCERRNHMVERMNKIDGVSALMPEGAFYVMMNLSKLKGKSLDGKVIETSDDFANLFLEKKKVAVVPCSGFGNDDFVRWSYATSMENIDKGLDRLTEFVSELK